MTETKTEGVSLTLTHTVAAPADRVFRALTSAEELKKWFCPEEFEVPIADMDVRVGGEYRIEMKAPDGEIYAVRGVIEELSPPNLLSYTWSWEEDEGEEHESKVTYRLSPDGDGTRIELVHTQLASDESAQRHQEGWNGCFANLSKHLES
jgi:uncharacterized protein YndB with AHSA1/START domain